MSKELEVAIKAAKEAGKILKERYYQANQVTIKEDKSFLTEADKLSETKIISIIKEAFPDHSINAEESGFAKQDSKYLWLVDPLDGTTNFVTKLPFFAVSIALVKGASLQVGVVYDPIHEAIYYAEKGAGTKLSDFSISVSDKERLADAMVGYARPRAGKEEFVRLISKLEPVTRTPKVLGSMALTLCLVASEALDVAIIINPHSWDMAAGSLIVEEAGGKITDFTGKSWSADSKNILASNGKIHDELLEILNS